MKKTAKVVCLALSVLATPIAYSQIPVSAAPDQQVLLESNNPELAANKKLVYDFWREVFEGGHLELADKYMTKDYIQHNPNVPTGRASFVEFFSKFSKPKPIGDKIKAPLVSIVAERDMVVLSFAQSYKDPNNAAETYTTTWFDMFRIENGKIAEHWDPAQKQ